MQKIPSSPAIVSLALHRLGELPVRPAVWQVECLRSPKWVVDGVREPFLPLLPVCCDSEGGLVGHGDLCVPGDPQGPGAIGAILQLAMMREVRYRPRCVEVLDEHLAGELRAALEPLGIEVAVVERLEAIEEVAESMRRHVGGPEADVQLFAHAIGIDRLQSFAIAAAEFCVAAPWNHLDGEDLILLDTIEAPPGMRCFTVMGSDGLECGIHFFSSREQYESIVESDEPERLGLDEPLWVLDLVDRTEFPVRDFETWEQHKLPVGAPDAFPRFQGLVGRDQAIVAGSAEVLFAEWILRAMATSTEDELDSGRWRKSIKTGQLKATLLLSIPAILEAQNASAADRRSRQPVPRDPRVHEQVMRRVHALIGRQQFDSPEEMQAFLSANLDKANEIHEPITPQEKALALLDRAYDEVGRVQLKLAREALALWPDAADAWVLRAEAAWDPERRLELYREGRDAGARAIGTGIFTQSAGHAWGVLETRPYLRACFGFAEALWDLGRHDEALAQWRELARLDPADHLAVADIAVPRLLEANRDADAGGLLEVLEMAESPIPLYAKALLAFRLRGPDADATTKLAQAVRSNRFVPLYLSGRSRLEGDMPGHLQPGSDDQARYVAASLMLAWRQTRGAVEWLGKSIRPPKRERRSARATGKGKQRR